MLFRSIWTGTEMIVWGGRLSTPSIKETYRNGGRYNPVTDSWTAISETKAPWGRAHHTAVWTGTQMIVWGGKHQDFDVNDGFYDGGRYNPSANSWTAVSTDAPPAGRIAHAAVWTGSKMLVWGGDGNGVLNEISHYSPGRVMYLYQRP